MKISILLLASAATILAGCSGNSNSNNSTATNNVATNATSKYDSGNPLTVVPDYMGAVMQAKKYSEKQIDLAYVNHAIQEFNAGEGHYPTNLQEMIPNYLGKMPQAPYGYKIIYDPKTGTVSVVKQ
ncbi:MAG: hypothetical protein ACREFE_09150 [Limisphaerales bacterium]